MANKSGHRERREVNTKEIRDLKQSNTNLKRQLARLKKEYAHLEATADTELTIEDDSEVESVAKCPNCGGLDTIVTIKTPNKTISRCKACLK
jgi:uncharacterized protein YlxW (UPF0749 family)